MSEYPSRQVDYGSANDGFLDEEAPDLGPLQEAAEAAELAEAMSGLTDSSGGPLPAGDPLRPLACAVARALTEAGITLHHCAPHHPRYRLGGVCLLPGAIVNTCGSRSFRRLRAGPSRWVVQRVFR